MQIAAAAALAGWHGHGENGWWRHGGGGYGWVGPLFWPFAYFDIYDYAIWGSAARAPFWGYGYDDIYAGMFAPYNYDALTGYLLPRGSDDAPDNLRHLTAIQPSLGRRFVFVTGDPTSVQGLDDEFSGVPVLAKPFTVTDLERVLGDVEVGV